MGALTDYILSRAVRHARNVFSSDAWIVKGARKVKGRIIVDVVRRRDGKWFAFEYDPRTGEFSVVRDEV